MSLVAEATVRDVSRQAWSASVPVLVHPAAAYVGLRAASTFIEKGQPLDVDVIVASLDGEALEGRDVIVEAERSRSRWARGAWIEEWVERGSADTPDEGE